MCILISGLLRSTSVLLLEKLFLKDIGFMSAQPTQSKIIKSKQYISRLKKNIKPLNTANQELHPFLVPGPKRSITISPRKLFISSFPPLSFFSFQLPFTPFSLYFFIPPHATSLHLYILRSLVVIYPNVSRRIKMYLKVSKCIQMHPNVSTCI